MLDDATHDALRSSHWYAGSDRNSYIHRAWMRPQKLLAAGVRDMVRISDARMSGTAYGTVILHVAPEAAAGGPLAFVRTGDIITLDVENRSLSMTVSDEELEARSQSPASEAAYAAPVRGWAKLYVDHVMGADQGADLDFLVGSSGEKVDRESH